MNKESKLIIEKGSKNAGKGGNLFGFSTKRTAPVSEKVSVNMNIATLAEIDLLVDQGYYSNRSDFINYAVRQSLEQKRSIFDRIIAQQETAESTWFMGIYSLEQEELERAQKSGQKLCISGYGLLLLNENLDDLIEENVLQIRVRGKVSCSARIREKFAL